MRYFKGKIFSAEIVESTLAEVAADICLNPEVLAKIHSNLKWKKGVELLSDLLEVPDASKIEPLSH